MVEKPDPAEAPSTLTIIGRYIIQPEVFGHLADAEPGSGGEIQLTDALDKLIDEGQPFHGLRFEGRRFDCGDKLGFLEATVALGLQHPELGPGLRKILCRPTSDRNRPMPHHFDPTILREYDIRGIVGQTLSAADARASGGPSRPPSAEAGGRRVAVGYDGRLTSPELEAALVDGLTDGGRRCRADRPRADADALLRGGDARGRWRGHGHRLAQPARP